MNSSSHILEKYSVHDDKFISFNELVVINVIDFVGGEFFSTNKKMFANFKMNDTEETVVRSLQVLDHVAPDSYLVLANILTTIKAVIASEVNLRLVVDISLPLYDELDIKNWEKRHLIKAFSLGCVGALVSEDNSHLAKSYPDYDFFRLTKI